MEIFMHFHFSSDKKMIIILKKKATYTLYTGKYTQIRTNSYPHTRTVELSSRLIIINEMKIDLVWPCQLNYSNKKSKPIPTIDCQCCVYLLIHIHIDSAVAALLLLLFFLHKGN